MKQHIVYLIRNERKFRIGIKPHSYIGSKWNYQGYGSYWGSSKNKIFQNEFKENKSDFSFTILESFNDILYSDLLEIERKYHIDNKVDVNDEYYNIQICHTPNGKRYSSKVMGDGTRNTRYVYNPISGECKRVQIDDIPDGWCLGMSKEFKDKRNIKLIPSLKEKMAGDKNPFYGKTHSEETRKSISNKALGRPSKFKNKSHTLENKNLFSVQKSAGTYITPYGSSNMMKEIVRLHPGFTNHLIRKWCTNPDTIINKITISQVSHDLLNLDDCGKTVGELGYNLIK